MFPKISGGENQAKHNFVLWFFLAVAIPLSFAYIIPPVHWIVFEICMWATSFGIIIIVRCLERQPLQSIGLRRLTLKESLMALLFGVLLFLLVPILSIFMERLFNASTNITNIVKPFASKPIWFCAIAAARPGFVKEILYRGYLMERLNHLFGKMWPGALLSLAIFTGIHLPFLGLAGTIGIVLPISTILTGLYIWKRNLILNIIAHFLTDFLVLVLLPLLMPR